MPAWRAQGHFQVFFHNTHCPLFQHGLSYLQRIMYCQGVWSYIVGAISTPTFVCVPLVTIWAGVFPIVLNWWAALGLTAYYVATTLVSTLCEAVRLGLFQVPIHPSVGSALPSKLPIA